MSNDDTLQTPLPDINLENLLDSDLAEQTEVSNKGLNSSSKIESISRSLCEELNSSTFEATEWLKKVTAFSQERHNRLVYSVISDYIFSLEQRDRVTTNIKDAVNYILSREDREYPLTTKKMVIKLYDHINLAIRQKNMFDKDEEDLRKQIEEIVKPEIELKSASLTKDMTGQLVSLIAIFTALSFIVFGGISSLDSIFQSLQSTMKYKSTVLPTLIVTVAWALCLMNLLFGFMYFVLRIAGLQNQSDKGSNQNLVQRYPVVFFCDYVLSILMVFLGFAWFAECNGIGRDIFHFWVIDHHSFTFFIIIIVIGVVFFLLWRKGKQLYKGTDNPPHGS